MLELKLYNCLQRKHVANLNDFKFSNGFLHMTPKAQVTDEINRQTESHQN